MVRFRIELDEGTAVSRALVVVGTPTMGLVGAIVAHHLVRSLHMRSVGRIVARDLPPVVRIREGRAFPVLELYETAADCAGLACERLVVIAAELTPEEDHARPFARDVLAWARSIGAPLVLVPDGVEQADASEVRVLGAASSRDARAHLETLGVAPLRDGLLGGLSAAFLDEGPAQNVPVVTLLGESTPDAPDARAAAAIVQVLARVLPGLPIDPAPLLADAEQIERSIRDAMERASRADESGAAMFG